MLPSELLYLAFRLLPPRDLKTAVLVCRRWREVGQAQGLWAWVLLRVTRENMATMATRVLGSRRLQAVRRVRLEVVASEELLERIVVHPGLKILDIKCPPRGEARRIHGILAREFPPYWEEEGEVEEAEAGTNLLHSKLLVKAINKMEEVNFQCGCNWDPSLADHLFGEERESSHLKRVKFWQNLHLVSPGLLAKAAANLVEMDVTGLGLTRNQLEVVFTALLEDSKLTRLKIGGNYLDGLEPLLLARAVCRLEFADLTSTCLKYHQLEAICAQVSKNSYRLRKLVLNKNNMTLVDPGLLAGAEEIIGSLL